MESPSKMSPEAIKSNIQYYRAVHARLTREATDAWEQVVMWTDLLQEKAQPQQPVTD